MKKSNIILNSDNKSYCSKCFEELTYGSICVNCGYDNDTWVDSIYIEPKTIILKDRYVVGAVLEHESDAVTYSGYDLQLDKVIIIRELLPKGIANRLEGNLDVHIRGRYISYFGKLKTSFINLWQTIMKISVLSAVIPTYDVFECNGTVYAVSEHVESISLREYLLRSDNGIISWDIARIMFMPVITTLEALHNNGIIHGGISPDSLVLCCDGKMRLKGFCICEANTFSSELEFNKNAGYTAFEQYKNDFEICPATDIYAFSACIYRALVGHNPPDAESRAINDKLMIPNTIVEKIPIYVIKALGEALQIDPNNRTKTISEFRQALFKNSSDDLLESFTDNSNVYNKSQDSSFPFKGFKRKSPFKVFKKSYTKNVDTTTKQNQEKDKCLKNQKMMHPYSGKKSYVFISYAHKDKKEVYPIIDKLMNDGFRVWYDDGIDPGTEWDENIAKHIEECGYFISFISENYLKSSNCKDELNFARDLDKDRFLIYLENVNLPSGMNMRLSRLQNIHKYVYSSFDEFYNKLLSAKGIENFK